MPSLTNKSQGRKMKTMFEETSESSEILAKQSINVQSNNHNEMKADSVGYSIIESHHLHVRTHVSV